ncbi:murein transglycosylase [Zophobihabitans entericus]|uniref:Murein transglycosylase n=1 Tax=Zophobihabitans entericus TaxID=1635327 RepID=A0A6G9IA14_9GAMM|nr:murein transglycosylase [Zophobihabitans entericus]QIQ20672.1 murein transglycosylase [Zophobihabitans entericus]
MFGALLKATGVVGLVASLCSYSYASTSLHDLRERYRTWNTTHAKLEPAEQRKLLDSLKEYSLYPYAQYQYLSANIKTVTPAEAQSFIKTYSDMPLSLDLQRLYIKELTARADWKTLSTFPVDSSIDSQCRVIYAKVQLDPKTKALEQMKDLWLLGKDLPSVCDDALKAWDDAGLKTPNLILLRTDKALSSGNVKLARYLAKQLPDSYKTTRGALLNVIDHPEKLADFSRAIKPSNFTRDITMASFLRYARINADKALALLPTLVKQQSLTTEQEQSLTEYIAGRYFGTDATPAQVKWRDNVISDSKNVSLIERRIRLALLGGEKEELAKWLNVLPTSAKQKDEWQYWQAQLLYRESKTSEGDTILKKLAQGRGFYPMLSAEHLGIKYNFDFNYSVTDSTSPQVEQTLLKDRYSKEPAIQRIKELRYWGNYKETGREWRFFLNKDPNEKRMAELARYAYSEGWGAHSVQATIAGKLWNNWVERFPVVYSDIFKDAMKNHDISLSYAMAISRQESALEANVQSPAGARGLMQLMPGTAKDTARKLTDINYQSAEQLFEPLVNIRLGTQFLEQVYQQFDKNRVLASAAYNAGPTRVKRWLDESQGKLDVAAFIESIPFTETRNYVKSVLVYDYIYQLIMNNKASGILTESEFTRLY